MKTLTLLALSAILAPALLLASMSARRESWPWVTVAVAVLAVAVGGIQYLLDGGMQ